MTTTKASKAKVSAAKATRKRTPVQKVERKHFAIGLPIRVRAGAKPIGWGDDKFGPGNPGYWDKGDYLRTYSIQSVSDDGASFEVAGWYWAPEDLEIPYT